MSKRKWNGREPRDIPQRGGGHNVWCYADVGGLVVACRSPGGVITAARLTWRQIHKMERDFTERTP